MRDVYRLLQDKEAHLAQVRREVESLRTVIPFLRDDSDPEATTSETPADETSGDHSEATGTDAPLSSFSAASERPAFWKILKRG